MTEPTTTQPTTLHLVARTLVFRPAAEPGLRDTFEVIGEDGNVEAVIYMAAAAHGAAGWHIVSTNSWANS